MLGLLEDNAPSGASLGRGSAPKGEFATNKTYEQGERTSENLQRTSDSTTWYMTTKKFVKPELSLTCKRRRDPERGPSGGVRCTCRIWKTSR